MRKAYSKKAQQFAEFADRVVEHIDNYVVPQYGDHPDEMLETLALKDVQYQLQRYAKRIVDSSRPNELVRDYIKIAHYACYLHSLLTTGGADG